MSFPREPQAYWTFVAQVEHDRAAKKAATAVAQGSAEKRKLWLSAMTQNAASGGMVEFKQWSYEAEQIAATGQWEMRPIDLDLSHAVAVTMTAEAKMPQEPSHGSEGGYSDGKDIWTLHEELTLHITLQDNLGGQYWHEIGSVVLSTSANYNILRVIDSLGSQCRLALWAAPVIAKKRIDNGVVEKRQNHYVANQDYGQLTQRIEGLKVVVAARII